MDQISCTNDHECLTYLLNLTTETSVDASGCYAEIGNKCACSTEWGWSGQYCNQITNRTIYNSLIFVGATLFGIAIAFYRGRVMYDIIRAGILKFNPSGVTTIFAWITLMIQILSGSLYIAAFYIPHIPFTKIAFDIQYIGFGTVVLSVLGVIICFYEVSKKAIYKIHVPRVPVVVVVMLFLASYIIFNELEYEIIVVILVFIEGFILFVGLCATVTMLNNKFSPSLIHAEWRQDVKSESCIKWIGKTRASISIAYLLAKHIICFTDVAAGRLTEKEMEELEKKQQQQQTQNKRISAALKTLTSIKMPGAFTSSTPYTLSLNSGNQLDDINEASVHSKAGGPSPRPSTVSEEGDEDPHDGYRFYVNYSNISKPMSYEDLEKQKQLDVKRKKLAERAEQGDNGSFFSPFSGNINDSFAERRETMLKEGSNHGFSKNNASTNNLLSYGEDSAHGRNIYRDEGSVHRGWNFFGLGTPEASVHGNKNYYNEGSYHGAKGYTGEGSYHGGRNYNGEGSYHGGKSYINKESSAHGGNKAGGYTNEGSYHGGRNYNGEGSYHGGKNYYNEGSYHGGNKAYTGNGEGSVHGGRARSPSGSMFTGFGFSKAKEQKPKNRVPDMVVERRFNRHTVKFLSRVFILVFRLFLSLILYAAAQLLVYLWTHKYENPNDLPISLLSIWKAFQLISIAESSNDILWFVNESSKKNLAKHKEERRRKTAFKNGTSTTAHSDKGLAKNSSLAQFNKDGEKKDQDPKKESFTSNTSIITKPGLVKSDLSSSMEDMSGVVDKFIAEEGEPAETEPSGVPEAPAALPALAVVPEVNVDKDNNNTEESNAESGSAAPQDP